jgi:hypothetical protein
MRIDTNSEMKAVCGFTIEKHSGVWQYCYDDY